MSEKTQLHNSMIKTELSTILDFNVNNNNGKKADETLRRCGGKFMASY